MLARLQKAAWIALFGCFVVGFGFVAYSALQQAPPPHSVNHSGERQKAGDGASNKYEIHKSLWQRATEDATAFFTLWIAVFTFVLAASTIGLWIATILTLRHSRQTAERQLRAYVLAVSSDIQLIENHFIQTFLNLKNFGQTPAYDLQNWIKMKVAEPTKVPFFESSPFEQNAVIGPGGEFILVSDKITLSEEELSAIRDRKKIIFVWGEAIYRDAFGNRWRFRFCASNGETMVQIKNVTGVISPSWPLSPYPDFGYQETEDKTG